MLIWGFNGSFHVKLDLWLNKQNYSRLVKRKALSSLFGGWL